MTEQDNSSTPIRWAHFIRAVDMALVCTLCNGCDWSSEHASESMKWHTADCPLYGRADILEKIADFDYRPPSTGWGEVRGTLCAQTTPGRQDNPASMQFYLDNATLVFGNRPEWDSRGITRVQMWWHDFLPPNYYAEHLAVHLGKTASVHGQLNFNWAGSYHNCSDNQIVLPMFVSALIVEKL